MLLSQQRKIVKAYGTFDDQDKLGQTQRMVLRAFKNRDSQRRGLLPNLFTQPTILWKGYAQQFYFSEKYDDLMKVLCCHREIKKDYAIALKDKEAIERVSEEFSLEVRIYFCGLGPDKQLWIKGITRFENIKWGPVRRGEPPNPEYKYIVLRKRNVENGGSYL